ncbi:MAG: cellulase family glycosylhydrolase [Bacteroidales bacterium]|nr:cellulase family glycosylhydrolase [Bacteroidales bacterium]
MKKIVVIISFLLCTISLLPQSDAMGWIKVSGNTFVDDNGNTQIFRGVNIADPDRLVKNGHWTRAHFQEAKAWGANVIRIPVHPAAWRNQGTENYLKLLDQAVEWANELKLYLIIDWHSIGNLLTGKYQREMYITTIEETFEFWDIISKRYADQPAVAFYELFNEPTNNHGKYGALRWPDWKAINIEMIRIIFKNNPAAIPLVAGFNWAYDLLVMQHNLIDIEGIAYVSHPYPQKTSKPWEKKWDKDFGFIAEEAPLMLTEIGFALPDEKGVHRPVTGDEEYGEAIVNYSKSKGIFWVVWVFDPNWAPMMFKDWDYTPTRQGAFFKRVMLEQNK